MKTSGDSISSRPISAAWTIALALLVGLAVFHRPQVVCTSACTSASTSVAPLSEQEDPRAIEAAVEAWKQMWAELEVKGVDALDPNVSVVGAQYAGDTCGMRYRRLYRKVAPKDRERLIIASFANDPQLVRRALEPVLASPDPRIKARAAVELARVALRQKETDRAVAALDEINGLALPPACEADVYYLRGRVAQQGGNINAALDALSMATVLDRGFWNAWRDQIPLLVSALHESPRRTAECLHHTRRLIEILGLLPQLANDASQFGKLALLLDRMGAQSSATLLASALAWQWAGQELYAHRILQRAIDAPALLPAACERQVRVQIASKLGEA